MHYKNASCPNLLDTRDLLFTSFHNALDNAMCMRGIGANSKQTVPDNKKVWNTGVLGYDNPTALLNIVFYISVYRKGRNREI